MASVLLLVYERGICLYYGGKVYWEEMPLGWIEPASVETDILRGVLKRAQKELGYQRPSFDVLLFSEFLHFNPEIKEHMRPTREEILSLVEEKLSAFYSNYPQGTTSFIYTLGVNGLYATAVSHRVLEALARVLGSNVRFYSGHFSLFRMVKGLTQGQPRTLGFWVEGGTAIGVSLLMGDLYALSRVALLEGDILQGDLQGDALRDFQSRLEEEIGVLLPPGMGAVSLAVGGKDRGIFDLLDFSVSYTVLDLEELWDSPSVEKEKALYGAFHSPKRESNLGKNLIPIALGLLAFGVLVYGQFLDAKLKNLAAEVEARKKEIEEARALEAEIPSLEERIQQYRKALEVAKGYPRPTEVILPLLEAWELSQVKFSYRNISWQGDSLFFTLLVPQGKSPLDFLPYLKRLFEEVGYGEVSLEKYYREGGKSEEFLVRLQRSR